MKNPLSLRLLYLLTKISYWGLIILIGIIVFAGIIMLTLDPELMELGFSSNLFHIEQVIYLKGDLNTPIEVEFSADTIKVPVKYLDRPTMTYVLLLSLLYLSCLLFVIRYFKTFIRKVMDGQIFHSESIFLLKKAALGLVIMELLDWIAATVGYFYVQRNFDLGDLESSFSLSFPSTTLIIALTLWVLAYIFQKGKEMEDEQKLTV
jgi:hypothetical protein